MRTADDTWAVLLPYTDPNVTDKMYSGPTCVLELTHTNRQTDLHALRSFPYLSDVYLPVASHYRH
jgi:hypothetical protein